MIKSTTFLLLLCSLSLSADPGVSPALEWIRSSPRPGYVHILLDTSCSMRDNRIRAAVQQAALIVSQLEIGWQLQLTTFADSTDSISNEYFPISTEKRAECLEWLHSRHTGDGTNFNIMFNYATQLPPDMNAPILVVIISDGIQEMLGEITQIAATIANSWMANHKCLLWIQIGFAEDRLGQKIVPLANRGWKLSSQLAVVKE